MAVVTVTPAQVSPTNETEFERRTYKAAAALEAGDVCIWDANGKVTPTGGTAPVAGTQIAGIALRKCSAGEAITLFQRGHISGWDLSGASQFDAVGAGTNGDLNDDTTTAAPVAIGMALPFSASGELMLYIDVTKTWA